MIKANKAKRIVTRAAWDRKAGVHTDRKKRANKQACRTCNTSEGW